MKNESSSPVHYALFHRTQYSIFVDNRYSYEVYPIYGRKIDSGLILDEKKLKRRLLNKIIRLNNDRMNHYSKIKDKVLINDNTEFKILGFSAVREGESDVGGYYSIYPLEFICAKCGKIYVAKNTKELSNIPPACTNNNCGGILEQNTILMYCEECGNIETMKCRCSVSDHTDKHAYINRKVRDDIRTWESYCKACRDKGGRPVDFMRHNCYCGGKRVPLPVRDGGIISPVILTTIDLECKPQKDSEYIRTAIECNLIENDQLKKLLPSLDLNEDLFNNIHQIMSIAELPLVSHQVEKGVQYIDSAVDKVKTMYDGVDLDELNDVHAVLRQSSSYEDYLKTLKSDEYELYSSQYIKIKNELKICDIRYVKELRIVSSAIGVIRGINKFYEDDFVPHFVPFRERRTDKEIYAISYPTTTEGILFRLDPVKVCEWLRDNQFTSIDAFDKTKAIEHLQRMDMNSVEYDAVKTLIHTFSHILIKQSPIFTGLDDRTCGELLFVSDASVLIYSTSNVNIGGFEYAFNYSIPNWFSQSQSSAEDCTFDPTCSNEGGRCFSCLFVPEFVCCNFNKQLSRHTLIGGNLYGQGYWR